jgi:LysR family transcriptional regulator, transcriptional activator of the cysJI operon
MIAMASLENFRLVVFRAVAEHLSFRKAAEQLYLTQPAVSLQIKALEQDLDAQLFERTGTHVSLTPAGHVLLRYATRVHALSADTEAALAAVVGERGGELALGASTTIAQYVLPRILGEFRAQHPRVSLRLISGNTEQVVAALVSGDIALGFIEGPAHSREVKTEPFLLDEMLFLVPAAHEWAERDGIPVAEIPSAPLLMRERGSGSREVVEAALARHGIRRASLHISMELDSTEAIKSAVEAGLGVGFVSRWALAKDSRLGSAFAVVPIAGLRIHRDLFIASPASASPHPLAADLRRFLLTRTSVAQAERTLKPSHKKSK